MLEMVPGIEGGNIIRKTALFAISNQNRSTI